jgi:H+/Cl- antiporter ClcA
VAEARGSADAGGYLKLLLVTALIGVPVSLAAFALLALLRWLEHGLWVDLPHSLGWDVAPWWWPLPWLLLAGALVGAVVRWAPGHGGHPPIEGIKAEPVPLRHVPGALAAAVAGLSLGAVLGPEAPLLVLGTATATVLARPAGFPAGGRLAAAIGVAGAAAALSVVLGSPLVSAVFLLEAVGLAGPQLSALILPCLCCAGIGAVVFTGLGAWTGLSVEKLALTLPAGQARLDVPDLLWTVPVAVAAAVGVSLVHRLGRRVVPWVGKRPLAFTVVAAVAVGACAAAYALVADRDPAEVALSGQSALVALTADPGAWPVGVLVALLLFKALAYGISLGALRGGPIFPAVFLGATAGVLASHLPGFGPVAALAAGMAAGTAAVLRLPVSAAVLVVLLLGSAGADVMPIVLLAAVIGVVTNRRFESGPARD